MRIWKWRKVGRNRWAFGSGNIKARIESQGRENHRVCIQDDMFDGTYDYESGRHTKWIHAYRDVTGRMKIISRKIRSKLGGGG